MAREVCYLLDADGALLWSDASSSPLGLPDSRARWEAIWERRHELAEIAHSHPLGPLAFSAEDETTMQALAAGLGRAPRFSVVTPEATLARDAGGERVLAGAAEPRWVASLRAASGMIMEEV
jgi:hypothetical protein